MDKYKKTDDMIPNKTLDEYIKEVIEPIEKKENKGIKIIDKDIFLLKNKKIRNLSKITYRLLNFIIYSHLFFANFLEYLDDEDLENFCLVKGMSCLEIIEYDLDELNDALNEQLIPSIEIFMNLIFPKISELINNVKSIKTFNERNFFEEEVETIFKECINNYNNYKKQYVYANYKHIESKKEKLKVFINELAPIEMYDNNEYPMLKYFMKTKYPNKDSFRAEFTKMKLKYYRNKYPLIS